MGSRDKMRRQQLTSTLPVDGDVAPAIVEPNPSPQGVVPNVNQLAQELANVIGVWVARQQWGALASQGHRARA